MIRDRLDTVIREISDFPIKGISFKDITPLLLDQDLSNEIIASFIDINKRFEAIKVKQLSNEQKKNISTTLNTYSKSITQLKSTVNSAVGSLHAHSSV